MNKKRISIGIFIIFVILCGAFLSFGRREVATVHNPSANDYYIKIYQIGYIPNDEYKCLCILYGPNGEISNEQFNAISIESGNPKYMKEGYNIITNWTDEYASVRVTDYKLGEIEKKFYLDGKITTEKRY